MKARFIDSYRFLQASLAELASNVPDAQMEQTRRFFPTTQLFEFARRKGVFPYEFIKSLADYEVTELPPIEAFYSSLNDEGISASEYEHAKRVWEVFQCSSMGEYSDLYLKIDVFLLADVFENFRQLCLEIYGLDPAWVYSAPGVAFNAMLKTTKVQMELFGDYDKYQFCKLAIRGGYCGASKRYAKANIPGTPDYNSTKPNSFLLYISKRIICMDIQ